ncbi:methionyl-tRNA formyltransferase [Lusitaniella coriacea LEGE 07157]|uniref:Methionyl-tRNA formyltransferase n=1 Tax=Lusitaniella coriacea LEGE 07157 TaxID=945747 RepID=A0A8J7DVB7_9CYAN|nr:methionyl-tRNA formyltransferase [Lusitaniella coriacea LEGE 07157]
MKIVFFGTPQFAVPSLNGLLNEPDIAVQAVVTQPDKPRGRGKKLIPSAVKQVALENNLPVWQPHRVKKEPETLELLRQTEADFFVVVAYGQILSLEILNMPKFGSINAHGSILPQYRGAAPIQWSLYNGDRETGITTMLMDEGMDTGAMLLTAYTDVELLENAQQLGIRLAEIGADILPETLFAVAEGSIQPIPQNNEQATYAPLIQKGDYTLDWSRPAIALHNQIRAFYPNCIATFRDKPLKILATVPLGEPYWTQLPPSLQILQQQYPDLSQSTGKPGEILGFAKKLGAIVQTGEGLLLLQEVQLAGKKPQSGWDFVNGMRLSVGEVLV